MFSVQGQRGPNDDRVAVLAYVWKPDSSGQRIDFIATLRDSLNGFCNWLDELEVILVAELSAQCATRGLAWTSPAKFPRVLLPVGMQEGTRDIPDDFLYLLICAGSLPLKGTYTVTIQK